MDLHFSLVVILLLFNATPVCFANDDYSSLKKNFISFNTGVNNNPIVQTVQLQTIPDDGDTFLYVFDTSGEKQPTVLSNPFLPQKNQPTVLSNPFLPQKNQAAVSSNPFLPQNLQTFSIPFSFNDNPFSRIESNMGSNTGSVLPSNIQVFYPSASDTLNRNTPSYYSTQFSAHYTTQSDTPTPPTPKSEISPTISSVSSSDLAPVKRGSQMTKSELKCEEYVREIAGTAKVASLVGTSPDVIKVTNVCEKANRLVTGGTEAGTGEFPHMVALGKYNSDGTFVLICGATLISHTWILTAAHCTYGPNGSPSHVRMGFNKLTDQQSGITVQIENMMRHPDYIPPAMYADIGLVQLVSPVGYNKVIRPACLYQQYDDAPRTAWISGWGVTEFAGDQSNSLQKAQLNLIDNLACTLRYNSSKEVPYGVTPRMICAGDPNGGWKKDSCQGDSGGPLQVIHPKNQCLFQVIGITSFGQGCAVMDSPGVYTRVSHYIPWIESIVWPEGR